MNVLVDTNVLLRLAQPESPHHATARAALVALDAAGAELCLVPQVIYEYWVVTTRQLSANGLGMTVPEAESAVEMLLSDYSLRRDERGVFGHWRSLVVANEVRGKNAHDARLVAAMARHGLSHLLTFNAADFARFPGVTVFDPADVASGRLPSLRP
jgi:predicted nucleic acid-binding protein